MSRLSSSTSSSEPPAPLPTESPVRDVVVIALWMAATLGVLDAAINVVFAYPKDPKVEPSRMRAFFEYGRSVEGKLARIVGSDDATAAPIATAGWSIPPLGSTAPTRRGSGSDLLVAFYGQSFSDQVAEVLRRVDWRVTLRTWGGPAAPPNAAFGLYLDDRGCHEADVVVLSLLASSVASMDSTSGMNCQFESPAPYTYPKFLADASRGLMVIEPTVRTLRGYPERSAGSCFLYWNGFGLRNLSGANRRSLPRIALIRAHAALDSSRRS